MRGADDCPDGPVVRLGRHAIKQFIVVEQRYRRNLRADPGERPVIGSAAPAEAAPRDVNGKRRDKDDVGPGHGTRAADRLYRLQQPPRPGSE